MVIAVMVSLSPVNASRADRYFFNQALSYLASLQPEHRYYICTDAPEEVVVKAGNVSALSVPYIKNSNRLVSLWRQVEYRQLLKKLDAGVVFYFGAGLYIKSRVPYCVLLKPGEVAPKRPGRLFKVLERAKGILTFSEAAKVAICQQFKVPAEKVGVVHAAAPETLPPTDEDFAIRVKERYTEGREYFLYAGSFEDDSSLINLLKAFSIFKKRQKTNWKLVLVNREQHLASRFTEALKTYKYRDDVVVLAKEAEDLSSLFGAAYAFVYPVAREDYGLYILEAMHFGIPVLTVQNKILQEIAGEAAIYYEGGVSDLAEKMMLLYKHEDLRSQKRELGREVVEQFSWERTAGEIGWAMGNGQ